MMKPIRPLALLIFLIGCEEEAITRLTASAAFDPAALDFGEASLGTVKELPAKLENTGSLPFELRSIRVEDPFFLGGTFLEGYSLAPGDTLELRLLFKPQEEATFSGHLLVSNGEERAVLDLAGTGVDRALSALAIDPTSLDFGTVTIGTELAATVAVHNSGTKEGTITATTLASTVGIFRVTSALPITVAPESTEVVSLAFVPVAEPLVEDRIRFDTDSDPLTLEVAGRGMVARGELSCSPAAVDFGQLVRGRSATREVRCTATGPVSFGGARLSPAHPAFAMQAVNPGSLSGGDSITIPLTYSASGLPARHNTRLRIDHTGSDGPGTISISLTGEVVAPPPTETSISLVLRWVSDVNDVDLHLVQPGGTLFGDDGSDCYFNNMSPDWGAPTDPVDNPFLDVDDVNGYGPENINLAETAAGDYEVFVHFYDDEELGPTEASVEVHLAGRSIGTFTHSNLACNDLWHVGTIHWAGASGTFTERATIQASDEGICF